MIPIIVVCSTAVLYALIAVGLYAYKQLKFRRWHRANHQAWLAHARLNGLIGYPGESEASQLARYRRHYED